MKKWICFLYNHWNTLILFTGCFTTCPRIFPNFSGLFEYIQRNPWGHWMFTDIPGKFGDIPRNFWGNSRYVCRFFSECLGKVPGMFNICRIIGQHSSECLLTFFRKQHYSYSPRSRIPFPFPKSCFYTWPLFNEVFWFSSLKKNTTNQALNVPKTWTVIWRNLERFDVCFL